MSESTAKAAPGKTTATKPNLPALVQTLQFSWFVGHLLTVIATILFALSYIRIFPNASWLWYKLALVGVIESFGVLIYQLVRKSGVNVKTLIADENVQYLLLAVVLFVQSPYVFLTLSTFFLFSTFHVLSYLKNFLLPALGVSDQSRISEQIGAFVAANNNKSIGLASLLEVYTLVSLFVRVITFSKRSIVPFLAYAVFMKLKFEKLAFTRNAFKQLEMSIEGLVNRTGHPAAKNAWIKVKSVFERIGAFSLIQQKDKTT